MVSCCRYIDAECPDPDIAVTAGAERSYSSRVRTTQEAGIGDRLSTVSTKGALLVASHAMERAFQDVNTGGLSEDGPPNAADASGKGVDARLGAHEHTIIVAFTGDGDSLSAGVTGVSLSPDDGRANDWVLTMVRGAFAAVSAPQGTRGG
jgi:hypothetical protein